MQFLRANCTCALHKPDHERKRHQQPRGERLPVFGVGLALLGTPVAAVAAALLAPFGSVAGTVGVGVSVGLPEALPGGGGKCFRGCGTSIPAPSPCLPPRVPAGRAGRRWPLSQIRFLLAPKWQAALELIWEKLRD